MAKGVVELSTPHKLQCNDVCGKKTESLYPADSQFWSALLDYVQGFVAFYLNCCRVPEGVNGC